MNEMCPLDSHEDEMGKNIKMKPSIQRCVGGIFYGLTGLERDRETRKCIRMNRQALSAGGKQEYVLY